MLNDIATNACTCLTAKEPFSASVSVDELDMFLGSCLILSGDNLAAVSELLTLRKASLADERATAKLGEDVAMRLLTTNCPAFLRLIKARIAAKATAGPASVPDNNADSTATMELDSADIMSADITSADMTAESPSPVAADLQVAGRFVRVDATGELVRLQLKQDNGRIETFYWLTRFDNEDYLLRPAHYKLRRLGVTYTTTDIYFPKKRRYITVNVLKSITGLD